MTTRYRTVIPLEDEPLEELEVEQQQQDETWRLDAPVRCTFCDVPGHHLQVVRIIPMKVSCSSFPLQEGFVALCEACVEQLGDDDLSYL